MKFFLRGMEPWHEIEMKLSIKRSIAHLVAKPNIFKS